MIINCILPFYQQKVLNKIRVKGLTFQKCKQNPQKIKKDKSHYRVGEAMNKKTIKKTKYTLREKKGNKKCPI